MPWGWAPTPQSGRQRPTGDKGRGSLSFSWWDMPKFLLPCPESASSGAVVLTLDVSWKLLRCFLKMPLPRPQPSTVGADSLG